MTDVTTSLLPAGRPTAEETARRTRSRNAAETRFKAYGIAAIAIGLFFLVALLYAILTNGMGAFQHRSVFAIGTLSLYVRCRSPLWSRAIRS